MTNNKNNMKTLLFLGEEFLIEDLPDTYKFEKMVTSDHRDFVILKRYDPILKGFTNTTLIFPINIQEKLT